MTRLRVEPGVCGFVSTVTADSEDGQECQITVETGCKAISDLMAAAGDTFDAYALCMAKPGTGPLWEAGSLPLHAACPLMSAIVKCAEAECGLALRRDVAFTFLSE